MTDEQLIALLACIIITASVTADRPKAHQADEYLDASLTLARKLLKEAKK